MSQLSALACPQPGFGQAFKQAVQRGGRAARHRRRLTVGAVGEMGEALDAHVSARWGRAFPAAMAAAVGPVLRAAPHGSRTHSSSALLYCSLSQRPSPYSAHPYTTVAPMILNMIFLVGSLRAALGHPCPAVVPWSSILRRAATAGVAARTIL